MVFNSYLQLLKCLSVIHVLNVPMMSSVWRLFDDCDDPNNRSALLLRVGQHIQVVVCIIQTYATLLGLWFMADLLLSLIKILSCFCDNGWLVFNYSLLVKHISLPYK